MKTAELHANGTSCHCPHCGKLNMDLDVAGDPVGEEFMCLRCGEEFVVERAASAPQAPAAAGDQPTTCATPSCGSTTGSERQVPNNPERLNMKTIKPYGTGLMEHPVCTFAAMIAQRDALLAALIELVENSEESTGYLAKFRALIASAQSGTQVPAPPANSL